jgi:hypothetical protein
MLRLSRIFLPVLSVLSLLAVLVGSLAFVAPARAATGPVCYVKADASGANNGNSWTDAYKDLQTALGDANCTEIWAAAGTYKPTSGTDRTATFQLINGVALYGGFAGTETARSQRNPAVNVTILSGDLNGNDGPNFANYSDNSYHVIIGHYTDASTILDGFTVRGGNANSPGDEFGGGFTGSYA